MDKTDLEWLKGRLHKDNCRQCDLVRDLMRMVDTA